MMKGARVAGHVLTPGGFVSGVVEFDANGRIAGISGSPVEASRVRDSKEPLVLPEIGRAHV